MQKVILRQHHGFGSARAIAMYVFKSKPDIVRARLCDTSCTVSGPGQGCRVWRAAVVERDDSGRIVRDGQALRDMLGEYLGKSLNGNGREEEVTSVKTEAGIAMES